MKKSNLTTCKGFENESLCDKCKRKNSDNTNLLVKELAVNMHGRKSCIYFS